MCRRELSEDTQRCPKSPSNQCFQRGSHNTVDPEKVRLEAVRIRSMHAYRSDVTTLRERPRLHECRAEQSFGVPAVCYHLE